MKYNQDAHGHAMYDYYKGNRFSEVIERDDGNINASNGPGAYFLPYQDWSSIQKKALRYVKGKILDIGCGAGKHSIYLQQKGFDVLGIDSSPLAIKVCQLRGLKKTEVLSITQLSPKLGKFDTILMLGNNFGLFANFKRARWLLHRFNGMTNNRAIIIAETLDPYQTKDPIHLSYHKLNRKRDRMPGQARIRVRYRKFVTPWFDYLLVSRPEMQKLLTSTGWKVKRFIDSKEPIYIAIIEKE